MRTAEPNLPRNHITPYLWQTISAVPESINFIDISIRENKATFFDHHGGYNPRPILPPANEALT